MIRTVPLTIAGSDPTGGAGLEADLKVFFAHGFSGTALATALTVQDSRKVYSVAPVAGPLFRQRLEILLADIPVGGVKIGLLCGAHMVRLLAKLLKNGPHCPLVVDPVLAPSRGAPFLDRAGQRALLRHLLPLAAVVTPNFNEAAQLLGMSTAVVRRHPRRACALLRETGVDAVLLKGGHGSGATARDLLDSGEGCRVFELPRLPRRHGGVHGTGCALSAALLANLISGATLPTATGRAKRYVHHALRGAVTVGAGALQLEFQRRQSAQ